MPNSPILIVEDDKDDCEFITATFSAIGVKNEFLWFENAVEALNYLKSTSRKTFMILSDINMPLMNGFEFRRTINEDPELRKKSIPFIFLTTSSSSRDVSKAFDLMVNGFFTKSNDDDAMSVVAKKIIEYWNTSRHPNALN